MRRTTPPNRELPFPEMPVMWRLRNSGQARGVIRCGNLHVEYCLYPILPLCLPANRMNISLFQNDACNCLNWTPCLWNIIFYSEIWNQNSSYLSINSGCVFPSHFRGKEHLLKDCCKTLSSNLLFLIEVLD